MAYSLFHTLLKKDEALALFKQVTAITAKEVNAYAC